MPAANEPRGAKPGMIERNGGPNLSALGLADTMGKRRFIERRAPGGLICKHLQGQG
jgi:hypothetical protein